MAEFKDQNLWMKLAFLHIMIGFFCEMFGFGLGMGASGKNSAEAVLIIGFLCYLTACVLALCLCFLDEVNGNKIALICFLIFALVAGLATIIGVAIWEDNINNGSTFGGLVGVTGALLAILAGIFGILEVVGVKPKA